VATAREAARKVEAHLLAKSLFDDAAAKEGDGEQLRKAGRLAEAVDVLRQGVVRYGEARQAAEGRIEQRRQADRARADMLGAKARANPETAEFKEGLTREKEGDSQYLGLAFNDAAKSFGAAASLFATAPLPRSTVPSPHATPPTPLPSPNVAADAEIRELVNLYSRVFAAKDLALLQRLRPGIRPEELSRYRDVFDQTRSYRLNLKVEGIKVNGDEAEARGRREDVVVTANGETVKTPGEFRFRF
jgi:hypothetical protein